MFTRKSTKRTVENLDKFFDIADQCLLVFEEGVKSYLYEEEARFATAVENISKLESEADDVRHQIDMDIYRQAGISGFRGDILRLTERLEHIVYVLSNDLFQFEVERPFIPITLRTDYLLLLELSVKAAGTAIPASRTFFRSPKNIQDTLHKVYFYQKEAVSGKVAAATYEIYIADVSGKAVSDKKTVIADKTSNNGSDRVFRTRFTLKSVEFKKTDTYYLTVVEKGTTNVADRIEFTIDIAFVNDFDF